MSKKVSLHKLHQWIISTNKLFEGANEAGQVEVTIADADVVREPAEDIQAIQEELHKLHELINDFDCSFHDKFDCR